MNTSLMQSRKAKLPPSRAVLVILPLSLIEQLDQAAVALQMNRSDVIRRCLIRDVASNVGDEIARSRLRAEQKAASSWLHWMR